jgi:hypothetical protein
MKFYIILSGNLCVSICASIKYGFVVILVVMEVGVVTKYWGVVFWY